MSKLWNTYHRRTKIDDQSISFHLDSLMDSWLLQTPDDQLCPKYLAIKHKLQTIINNS